MAATGRAKTGIDSAAAVSGESGQRLCGHDVRFSLHCLRADWAATNGGISKLVLLTYRLGHLVTAGHLPRPISAVLWPAYRFLDLVWMKLLAGAELPHTCCAGPGLRLAHGGRGVVVVVGTRIGSDVAIYHQVTLGSVETELGVWPLSAPVVGDHVRIGTGARVLGRVEVGDGAVIGANAVVLADVPAGARVRAGTRWSGSPPG